MTSFTSLQSQQERASSNYNDFEFKITQNYPKSKGNIPSYILIQLSRCREGTKNHQKWSMLYDNWCDYIGNKGRIRTALANYNHQALSIIQ